MMNYVFLIMCVISLSFVFHVLSLLPVINIRYIQLSYIKLKCVYIYNYVHM